MFKGKVSRVEGKARISYSLAKIYTPGTFSPDITKDGRQCLPGIFMQ
jgi:hypothetical protein